MKWYTYVICFVLIIVGTFLGIELYKDIKAESYVNGSIDISNQFSQESFNYSSTSVVFYNDIYNDANPDEYYFEVEQLKVDDFNGLTKQYQVELNDFVLIGADINAGSIFTTVYMDFYDTNGNIVCNSAMSLSIQFLSNKTQLRLATNGQESASFLEQYFSDNGIRLSVVEIL